MGGLCWLREDLDTQAGRSMKRGVFSPGEMQPERSWKEQAKAGLCKRAYSF